MSASSGSPTPTPGMRTPVVRPLGRPRLPAAGTTPEPVTLTVTVEGAVAKGGLFWARTYTGIRAKSPAPAELVTLTARVSLPL
jgi:hypothetical protein